MSQPKWLRGKSRGLTRQQGAATLLVTMVFLFSTSIVMLYLNRNVLFEQKTSANQMRATKALEMAEAGIEWATGMLNAPYDIDANCILQSSATSSFRKRYVQTHWGDGTATSSNVFPSSALPGCKIDESPMDGVSPTAPTQTCSCPATGAATLTATQPGFTVSFANTVPYDAEAVLVTATGCTSQSGACTAAADASATVQVILKLRAVLRAAPAAPLTCGTSCDVGTANNIINMDVETGGVLINAGTSITYPPNRMTTIPGLPAENAMIQNDPSLAALSSPDPTCANSAMFKTYFGSTLEQYRVSPTTKQISCSSANDCGTKLDAAYGSGWRAFYFTDGLDWNNSSGGSLGTPTDPVTIVSPSSINFNGNIDIYGMVFSNNYESDQLGFGTADIHGASVSCASYVSNGTGTIEYDAGVLRGLRRSTGIFVRVPGSWIDVIPSP